MIPRHLKLTNFLSYRQTADLDFQGIQQACICGLNGAGKSSILDAITWALFGQCRSKSDDDVINRAAQANGQPAEVQFAFCLHGGLYRVIRRKAAGKSVVLEYQMATDGNLGGDLDATRWKALGEGKVRDTQEKIEQLLNLNYETFTNASFLLQGKADEFTTRTPNRRKETLAEILSVNRWDQYKEVATNHRRIVEGRQDFLDVRLADIDRELAEEEERQNALAAARAELQQLVEQLALQEKLLEQLRRAEDARKRLQQLLKSSADNLARERQKLANLEQTQATRQAQRQGYQALLDQAEKIAADFAAWETAEAACQAWQQKADAYNTLQQAINPHRLALERERSRLQQRGRELESRAQSAVEAQQEHIRVSRTLAEGRSRLAHLMTRLADVTQQEIAWREAREALQGVESERKLWQLEMSQLEARSRRVAADEKERPPIERALQETEAALLALEKQRIAFSEMQNRLAAIRSVSDQRQAEQPRLKAEMDKISERLKRLEAEASEVCPLCGQHLTPQHRQRVMSQLRADGKEKADHYRANKAALEQLQQEMAGLEKATREPDRLERERQQLQQRQTKDQARLQEIQRAAAEWQTDGAAGRLAQLQKQLADDTILKAQQAQVAALAPAAQERQAVEKGQREAQQQVTTAEVKLAQLDTLVADWQQNGEPALAAVREQLAADRILPEAQQALAELETQVAALAYDPAAYEATRRQRDSLAQAPKRLQALQQAEAAVKPLDEAIAHGEQQIAEQRESLANMKQRHQDSEAQLAAVDGDESEVRQVEQQVFELREKVSIAEQRVGGAQQRVAVLDHLRQQRVGFVNDRADVTQQIQRLKVLEKACGRNGVQALLIERALPEIEDAANELLDRLTGGDMRVSFETQKQLKSRDGLVETLDIRISDGVGERPYENYSGGEQFRVNFAIRLALSRVLARRAGARLQTLVVDEGFGSQDPTGRQRLIEAINTVQDDFACILVITHIDELRDAFPTRIEVEKTTSGSRIVVV